MADLAAGAGEFEARHGLASVEGGRHPGWGTANRIVPLGKAYIELVAVIDPATAANSIFGRWVAGGASSRSRLLGWAVRTGRLDVVARRLGLTIDPGSRAAPDGQLLRWRSAGIEAAAADPSRPFFIEWGLGTRLPGQTPIRHQAGPVVITQLVLEGDPSGLAEWLGSHRLPVEIRPGTPAVRSVVLSGPEGEIVVGDASVRA